MFESVSSIEPAQCEGLGAAPLRTTEQEPPNSPGGELPAAGVHTRQGSGESRSAPTGGYMDADKLH